MLAANENGYYTVQQVSKLKSILGDDKQETHKALLIQLDKAQYNTAKKLRDLETVLVTPDKLKEL